VPHAPRRLGGPVARAFALALIGMSIVLGASAQAQPSTDWLEPFVGVWHTEDTYYPASGAPPIVEAATRTCAYVMAASYVQCETVAETGRGAGRVYRFLLNYNRTVRRFEMLSLWSNVPHKLVQALTPDADRRRWRVVNVGVIGDDEPMADHRSEIAFEGRDRAVWTGRRVTPGVAVEDAPLAFRETWVRVR
jgi:hypothetical protein